MKLYYDEDTTGGCTNKEHVWRTWFAWYPIKLEKEYTGQCSEIVWLKFVKRIKILDEHDFTDGEMWIYKLPNKHI